jgi:glycosyltransferase involved in cell wall biosynthesis
VSILGNGPEERALTLLAAQLGIADFVQFQGCVQDVTPYLRGADVFVFPSRYEGLPLALMEAMAAGLPVVASAVPGNTDLVQDNVTGLLVSPGDPIALSAAIARVLTDAELADSLGMAARSYVASRFDVNMMVYRTADVYRHALHVGG